MTIDHVALEALPPGDLLNRRQALIDKGRGSPANLGDSDLEELVTIYALLRRRSSGPPALKIKKEKVLAAIPSLF